MHKTFYIYLGIEYMYILDQSVRFGLLCSIHEERPRPVITANGGKLLTSNALPIMPTAGKSTVRIGSVLACMLIRSLRETHANVCTYEYKFTSVYLDSDIFILLFFSFAVNKIKIINIMIIENIFA